MNYQEVIYSKRKKAQRKMLIKLICIVDAVVLVLSLIILGSVRAVSPPIAVKDQSTSTESIVSCAPFPSTPPEPKKVPDPTYTEDELFCMAAAIYNEAGGDACSDETRLLVGQVILNRVNDPRFPDTIREVLEAKNQYGEFYWTGVKFADRSSLLQEKEAVNRAYEIAKRVLTEPSALPKTVVFQAEFEQGVGVYKYEDGIYFCHAKEVN